MSEWKKKAKQKLIDQGIKICSERVEDLSLSPTEKGKAFSNCLLNWLAAAETPSEKGDGSFDACMRGVVHAPDQETAREFANWCLRQVPVSERPRIAFQADEPPEIAAPLGAARREAEPEYQYYECNYCPRRCRLLSKGTELPVGCLYTDVFLPMDWIVRLGKFSTAEEARNLFICDYCKRDCCALTIGSKPPLSCPFLDEFIPMPWKLPTEGGQRFYMRTDEKKGEDIPPVGTFYKGRLNIGYVGGGQDNIFIPEMVLRQINQFIETPTVVDFTVWEPPEEFGIEEVWTSVKGRGLPFPSHSKKLPIDKGFLLSIHSETDQIKLSEVIQGTFGLIEYDMKEAEKRRRDIQFPQGSWSGWNALGLFHLHYHAPLAPTLMDLTHASFMDDILIGIGGYIDQTTVFIFCVKRWQYSWIDIFGSPLIKEIELICRNFLPQKVILYHTSVPSVTQVLDEHDALSPIYIYDKMERLQVSHAILRQLTEFFDVTIVTMDEDGVKVHKEFPTKEFTLRTDGRKYPERDSVEALLRQYGKMGVSDLELEQIAMKTGAPFKYVRQIAHKVGVPIRKGEFIGHRRIERDEVERLLRQYKETGVTTQEILQIAKVTGMTFDYVHHIASEINISSRRGHLLGGRRVERDEVEQLLRQHEETGVNALVLGQVAEATEMPIEYVRTVAKQIHIPLQKGELLGDQIRAFFEAGLLSDAEIAAAVGMAPAVIEKMRRTWVVSLKNEVPVEKRQRVEALLCMHKELGVTPQVLQQIAESVGTTYNYVYIITQHSHIPIWERKRREPTKEPQLKPVSLYGPPQGYKKRGEKELEQSISTHEDPQVRVLLALALSRRQTYQAYFDGDFIILPTKTGLPKETIWKILQDSEGKELVKPIKRAVRGTMVKKYYLTRKGREFLIHVHGGLPRFETDGKKGEEWEIIEALDRDAIRDWVRHFCNVFGRPPTYIEFATAFPEFLGYEQSRGGSFEAFIKECVSDDEELGYEEE